MILYKTKENYIYKCTRKGDGFWDGNIILIVEKRKIDCTLKHLIKGSFKKRYRTDSIDYRSPIGLSSFVEIGPKENFPEYFI